MAKTIPLLDLMFFVMENEKDPKHVAALMIFDRPEGASKRIVADLCAAYRKAKPVFPFDQVPAFALLKRPRWVPARSLDMKYHVQHRALPDGATEATLLDTVADIHARLLDRDQPGFRVHFIDGLPQGRFAMFAQIHHAMVDGASAVARIAASLDERSGAKAPQPFFAVELPASHGGEGPRANARSALPAVALKQAAALKEVYASLLRKSLRSDTRRSGSVPFAAPRGLTNSPTRTARSVATLSLPIAEMKAVAKAYGGTLNDVVVTIVDAALGRYLAAHGDAQREPLVAVCPISLREPGDTEATTKASAMCVPLGASRAAIGPRMRQVMRSIESAKGEIRGMSKDAAMLYGVLALGASEFAGRTGAQRVARPLANLIVSNVPGPRHDLYLGGARLANFYPISALGAGIGLNVTLLSYADSMDFGFVGNGAALPDLDALAQNTREAFAALKKSAPKTAADKSPRRAPTRASTSRSGGEARRPAA